MKTRTAPAVRCHHGGSARSVALSMAEKNTTNAIDYLPLPTAEHGHETHLFRGVVAERTGKMCGHRESAGLLYATQRHAHMLRFDHDCNATGLEDFVDCSRNLRRQMLLCL